MRLLPKERKALFRSLTILVLATFKIFIQMAVDYTLYWILITVRKYGRMSSQIDRIQREKKLLLYVYVYFVLFLFLTDSAPNVIDVNVDGDGMLADLYRSIIHTFKPVANQMNMDTINCLPNPLPPNYDCYRRISESSLI